MDLLQCGGIYLFRWHGPGPLFLLKWSVTVSSYKFLFTDHLYPTMKLMDLSSRMTPAHSRCVRAHWMVWRWKWCKSNAMAFPVTRSEPNYNTFGRFWSNVLKSTLHHPHQNNIWGDVFWRNGVHVIGRIWAKAHWSSSGNLWCPRTLLQIFRSTFQPLEFFSYISFMKIPFPRRWHPIITAHFIQDLRRTDIQCTVISVLLLGRLKREEKTTRLWPACFNAGKLKQRKHHKTMESLVCQESDTLVPGQEVHVAVKMKNQNPQMGAESRKRSPGSVMSDRLACAGRHERYMGMLKCLLP